jgi:hypothetical protein
LLLMGEFNIFAALNYWNLGLLICGLERYLWPPDLTASRSKMAT